MTRTKESQAADPAPDQLVVKPIQASRLASLTRLDAKAFLGSKLVEVAERLKWHIDPQLLFFRRVCGRVVRRDPVSGLEHGVPGATVEVQDTDCSLIGYFPEGSPYWWFYPFGCRRETLASVKTDECGNFCVWIPRWDIDWILRWRKERVCFPYIFERPRLVDVLERLFPKPERPPRPVPGPDPAPDADPLALVGRLSGTSDSQLAGLLGPRLARQVQELALNASFGSSAAEARQVLEQDALEGLRPPLPAEFKQIDASPDAERLQTHSMDLVRSTVAARLGIDAGRLSGFDLRNAIGPFRRCVTYLVPEWTLIVDAPDITFRVTQDVDGDGAEEQIYGESHFDVRWNAFDISPVKLVASSLARESRVCETPVVVCGTVPEIQFAGMMPVTAPYLDNASGYALRPNSPKPAPRPLASAPFCDSVNLFGCLVRTGGATKYRLVHRYSADGNTFSADAAFTGVRWWWHPVAGSPIHAVPDVNGWYDMPPAGLIGPEVNFLFPFNTGAYADGVYEIKLQVGSGGSGFTAPSSPVRLRVDNSQPTHAWDVRWRAAGSSDWTPLAYPCPVVRRGAEPQQVEFEVRWDVSASHYRDATIFAGGCGSGDFEAASVLPASTASDPPTHDWHGGELDNAVVFHARFVLPATAAQGTYSFRLHANSRAFNPSGAVAGYQENDWSFDAVHVYIRHWLLFSVIDAD